MLSYIYERQHISLFEVVYQVILKVKKRLRFRHSYLIHFHSVLVFPLGPVEGKLT